MSWESKGWITRSYLLPNNWGILANNLMKSETVSLMFSKYGNVILGVQYKNRRRYTVMSIYPRLKKIVVTIEKYKKSKNKKEVV